MAGHMFQNYDTLYCGVLPRIVAIFSALWAFFSKCVPIFISCVRSTQTYAKQTPIYLRYKQTNMCRWGHSRSSYKRHRIIRWQYSFFMYHRAEK